MVFHENWGERAERWQGVRSELREIGGTRTHLLTARGEADGTPHLLVHGLGGSATNWLEVLPDLARLGPVAALDLPGFGRTPPVATRDSRIGANSRFLRAALDDLGWDRAVVHGNSMGGLLAVLLADLEPDRVERLVLASPALPSPRSRVHRTSPRALARFAPFVVPGVGRAVVSRMWERSTPESLWRETVDRIYADPSRLSAELSQVGIDNLAYGRQQPWRLDGFVTAAESLMARMMRAGSLWEVVERSRPPTLLVWGEQDELITRPVIAEARRRRPDWDLAAFTGVGHCPQIEVPGRYVEAVSSWRPQAARLGA